MKKGEAIKQRCSLGKRDSNTNYVLSSKLQTQMVLIGFKIALVVFEGVFFKQRCFTWPQIQENLGKSKAPLRVMLLQGA